MGAAIAARRSERNRHIVRPPPQPIPGVVRPPPVPRPVEASPNVFAKQLMTVIDLFRDANFEELSRDGFLTRATSLFGTARAERDSDNAKYDREYRPLVRELAEYLIQNFDFITDGYRDLL
jgi:hypothetical protein